LGHEGGLIGGKQIMELCGIELREVVGRFLDCPDLLRTLGKRFPSCASLAPASGMHAAM